MIYYTFKATASATNFTKSSKKVYHFGINVWLHSNMVAR